jgi:hypothetical protein
MITIHLPLLTESSQSQTQSNPDPAKPNTFTQIGSIHPAFELRVIQRIQQRAAENSPFLLPCKDTASFPLW